MTRWFGRACLLLLLALVVHAASARADDMVGRDAFRRAEEPRAWSFPRDHGSHPDHQTEWWYFTGSLRDADARLFGYELTFFRFALRRSLPEASSPLRARDLILAHFAITDVANQRFHLREDVQRAAAGLAGADTLGLHVWMGDWSVTQRGGTFHLRAGGDMELDLTLVPERPVVLHGDAGLSWKSADRLHASHYYSIPRLETQGTLVLDGQARSVRGTSWMDHEFFTGDTPVQGVGWDWFSCRLEDGRDLMLYRLRYPDGSRFASGTLVQADGSSRPLAVEGLSMQVVRTWTSPRTQARYPVAWKLHLPREGLDLQVEPLLDDQEVHAQETVGFAYWEGLCRYRGTLAGDPVGGEGHVELTGYAP